MPNPNLELLELVAERLRQLLPEIVFVGGCATGLLIDDPAAAPVRGTYDVDVIAEIGSYAEYTVFSERLRALGFKEDSSEGAPLCRWIPFSKAPSSDKPQWKPYALALLERAPNKMEVLGHYIARFAPRSWSGSMSATGKQTLGSSITLTTTQISILPRLRDCGGMS